MKFQRALITQRNYPSNILDNEIKECSNTGKIIGLKMTTIRYTTEKVKQATYNYKHAKKIQVSPREQ